MTGNPPPEERKYLSHGFFQSEHFRFFESSRFLSYSHIASCPMKVSVYFTAISGRFIQIFTENRCQRIELQPAPILLDSVKTN